MGVEGLIYACYCLYLLQIPVVALIRYPGELVVVLVEDFDAFREYYRRVLNSRLLPALVNVAGAFLIVVYVLWL